MKKDCETCELGFDPECKPDLNKKGICVNWEIAFRIFQELPDEERKEIEKEWEQNDPCSPIPKIMDFRTDVSIKKMNYYNLIKDYIKKYKH